VKNWYGKAKTKRGDRARSHCTIGEHMASI
jgi:hypothetical protein